MCLLVLAWQVHPRYRLVVAANRDEFHERPAAPLGKWGLPDDILAGRDLRAHGTWLGLDRQRRFGVITNFRELQRPRPDAPTRGALIPDYLRGVSGADSFLADLEPQAPRYSGFNLLLTDRDSLWYASNRAEAFARCLSPGVYGLSNEFLDTPWPKLRRVRRRFDAWLDDPDNAAAADLFALLDDRATVTAEEELPQTGISEEWERVLSAPFVLNPDYGTRASTILLLEPSGAGVLAERRFDPQGTLLGETEFQLAAGDEWP
ncbi:MAG TPA: NRDE family protein [Steroidobacteraceae bacterium]